MTRETLIKWLKKARPEITQEDLELIQNATNIVEALKEIHERKEKE